MGNLLLVLPVAAGQEIQCATMAVLNTEGYAEAAAKASGLIIAGVAAQYADNRNGGNGDEKLLVRRGAFVFNNDGTIKVTDLLKTCYMVDAVTVTLTAAGSSEAGKILQVDTDGVTVDIQ